MAVPNPAVRFATNVFDTNGVTTDWEINFVGGYINAGFIHAYSVLHDSATGLETDRTDHNVVIVSSQGEAATVRVSPAVAAGRKLYIYRSTTVTNMLVDYVNGSLMSKANLNLSNEQLLNIIQEMLDNLNITSGVVNDQIGNIIDLSQIIRNIYTQVLQLLASGGIVSVAPQTWAGTWGDDNEDDTDFDMVGADVADAGFYDVYINGIGQEPGVDYQVTLASGTVPTFIRFANVPAKGSAWFATLRGYAKPYLGSTPITSNDLRLRVVEAAGPVFYLDADSEFALIHCTYAEGCNVAINDIAEVGSTKLGDGSYISIMQDGGPVTIIAPPNGALKVPAGCKAATRADGSVVTVTCLYGDANSWVISGDLAKE